MNFFDGVIFILCVANTVMLVNILRWIESWDEFDDEEDEGEDQ